MQLKITESRASYIMSFYSRKRVNLVASFSFKIQKARCILLWQRDMVTKIDTLSLIGYRALSTEKERRGSILNALTMNIQTLDFRGETLLNFNHIGPPHSPSNRISPMKSYATSLKAATVGDSGGFNSFIRNI